MPPPWVRCGTAWACFLRSRAPSPAAFIFCPSRSKWRPLSDSLPVFEAFSTSPRAVLWGCCPVFHLEMWAYPEFTDSERFRLAVSQSESVCSFNYYPHVNCKLKRIQVNSLCSLNCIFDLCFASVNAKTFVWQISVINNNESQRKAQLLHNTIWKVHFRERLALSQKRATEDQQ